MRLVKRSLYHLGKALTPQSIAADTIDAPLWSNTLRPLLTALLELSIPSPAGMEVFMTVVPAEGEKMEEWGTEAKFGFFFLYLQRKPTERDTIVPIVGTDLIALSKLFTENGSEAARRFIMQLIKENLPVVIEMLRKSLTPTQNQGKTPQEESREERTKEQIDLTFRFLALSENNGRLLDQ